MPFTTASTVLESALRLISPSSVANEVSFYGKRSGAICWWLLLPQVKSLSQGPGAEAGGTMASLSVWYPHCLSSISGSGVKVGRPHLLTALAWDLSPATGSWVQDEEHWSLANSQEESAKREPWVPGCRSLEWSACFVVPRVEWGEWSWFKYHRFSPFF